ncbi:hypothetical protein CC1G_06349 [Coprinopsis cinerea okayama7|uniref:Calcofluor white hypersensitive protein n=1 Tax=Coprinopsis cinerea (strain Okayama-7 / 130 / ATCC MYA-4618 / FGSC 9003) TaxID=240176 RepID=A8NTM0_COPC7|nr:hypothetical protein CC1G_06349 [Coprinopsis cinerea okayama7\|eukprot:XP_001836264.2 hypothetical protein CC1G_06349 [Coprinopsis cinerea okayama7\
MVALRICDILIALTAPPRIAILFLTYYLNRSEALFLFGFLRTLACGGWVYVTSSDHGLTHDVLMIGYIILNIPWMWGNVKLSRSRVVRRKRTGMTIAFFATLVPLVYFYIQHKVHRIPGAPSPGLNKVTNGIRDVYFRVSSKTNVHEEAKKASDGALKDALDTALAPASKTVTAAAGSSKDASQHPKKSCRTLPSFLSDVYLSYVFWSTFTALIPSLFYFSVWELGIAGQELALLSLLSPAFLTLSPLFFPVPSTATFLSSRKGQVIAYLAQFSALLAYLSKSPLVRLAIVTPSCAIMMQREVVLLSGLVSGDGTKSGKGLGYWGTITTLGFIVASLSKHANHGNNPIWPFIDPKNGGYNELGLGLALLALIEFATRPTPASSASTAPAPKHSKSTKPSFWSTFFTASVPLGSLVFSLHNLLADPSSLVAASWTGWENGAPRGPLPHVHGCVTMVVVSLGLALGVWSVRYSTLKEGRTNPLLSIPWFVVGCAGTYGMYKERNWEGYASSLVLALVLVSVAPAIFVRAAQAARSVGVVEDDREGAEITKECAGQVAKTFSSAMLVYILLNLASIFTVAYAFVPGGWVFRERTDAVLTAQLACLAFAFSWPAISSSAPTPRAAAGISAPARKFTFTSLAVISIASLLTTIYRHPMVPPKPHKPGSKLVNAGIWTVHFGINNEGHDSQRGMRDLIKDMQLDIVGLLETDLHRTAFGHRDLTRVMVEELGFNVDLGPGPNSHTWGAVLLTKYPIINTTHHLLPSPRGELAPAIEAVLDIYGTEVTVVVAHNGQEEDPLDRELQSTELARIMRESPRPVIFLGYVVTKPHKPRPHPYQIMVEDGNVHDIDATDKDRWCEYIFYRGLYRTAYARVSRGIITDTELQIGQFVVPSPAVKTINDSEESRYIRTTKENMPQDHWFPQEYHGNKKRGGKNGHYYHVFKTPRYYQLPEDAVV